VTAIKWLVISVLAAWVISWAAGIPALFVERSFGALAGMVTNAALMALWSWLAYSWSPLSIVQKAALVALTIAPTLVMPVGYVFSMFIFAVIFGVVRYRAERTGR
jgi:hypothetical protein